MMRTAIGKLHFTFYIFTAALLFTGKVLGAPPLPSNHGVDAVVLLDQSGSMSGCSDHPKANDPHGLRIDAVRNFINMLAAASLEAKASGAPQAHRIGIVEFGSKAKISLDWYEIDASKTQNVSTSGSFTKIKSTIREDDLGNTHFIDAFQRAKDLFREIDYGDDVPYERKLAIYLVTDGQPYSGGAKYSGPQGAFSMKKYWSCLNAELDGLKKEAANRNQSIMLFILALNDMKPYWNNMSARWNRFATDSEKIESNDAALYNCLNRFLLRLVHFDSQRVDSNSFDCPCYLSKVRFTVYQSNPGAGVTISTPEGTKADLKAAQVESWDTYAVYEFPRPQNGEWRIDGNKDTEIWVGKYYDDVRLKDPSPHSRVPDVPMKISWKVSASQTGDPFVNIAGCKYEVKCSVFKDGKQVDKLDMALTESGVFESTKSFSPQSVGDYEVDLEGKDTRTGHVIFEGAKQKITATGALPVVMSIVEPRSINMKFGKARVDLVLKASNFKNNKAVNVKDLGETLEKLVSVKIRNIEGDMVSSQVFFKPDSILGPDVLVAEVKIEDRFRPFSAFSIDMLNLDFTVHNQYINKKYFLYKVIGGQ